MHTHTDVDTMHMHTADETRENKKGLLYQCVFSCERVPVDLVRLSTACLRMCARGRLC